MTFNGTEISHPCPIVFRLSQLEKLTKLTKCESRADLISWRASIQYVSGSCRPYLTAFCQLAATPVAVPSPERATISLLNFFVQVCHDTCDDGLTFAPLDISSIRIVVHSDAAFANAEGLKSQLGFMILMVDDQGTGNIEHFGSRRCTRVTRSVIAAELLGLILGFDNAMFIKKMVTGILGRDISIDAMVDSQYIFDVISRLSTTTEKRLTIEVFSLQEAHRHGELASLFRILSMDNWLILSLRHLFSRKVLFVY